ncbi:MAG: hypothetical protein ACRD7E_08985, partial [Bryobacteraceae bacterium]
VAASMCGLWILAQTSAAQPSLARYCPPGSLLFFEARDFAAIVRDWNSSPEKQLWTGSDNFAVFSRSRLYLRLEEAQKEFAAAAGLLPDMSLAESLAGRQSSLALYDIGKLEFLYLTHLEVSRAVESALWRTRSSYELRNSAGLPYYVRTDPASGRVAAFASAKGLLLLATREDLVAASLALIAQQSGAALNQEPWYMAALKAAKAPGEIRMVMNMPAILRTPYFRSYWIQRNVSDLRPYSAVVSDIFREAREIREERVFLRGQPAENGPVREEGVAQLLAYVPPDAGLYRAWAAPPRTLVLSLIESKLVSPGLDSGEPAAAAFTGTEADLETRIDQEPLDLSPRNETLRLLGPLLEQVAVEALLHVQSSRTLPGGVFIGNHSALVLLGAKDWSFDAFRKILPSVQVGGQGRVLVLADTPEMLKAVSAKLSSSPAGPPSASEAAYAAGYRHGRELEPFTKMMSMIDHSTQAQWMPEGDSAREPFFFSENVASLGRALGRVESAAIIVHDNGRLVPQTITYRFSK